MELIKNLFGLACLFKDDAVISLSGLRKRSEYVKITIPEGYKKTYIPHFEHNYLLF